MPALVQFVTEGNHHVLVEIDEDPPRGLTPVADAGVAGKSGKTFEEAISGLGPIAKAVFDALNNVARRPTEISVELGFKISGKGTLILCSSEMEANFTATLKWVDPPRA